MNSHTKFLIAKERIMMEKDIQYMIEMNRVSRLLHKAKFLPRQRRVISFFNRYVLCPADIVKKENVLQGSNAKSARASVNIHNAPSNIDGLLDEFDPKDNLIDRRLFFEVTKMSLKQGEFNDDSDDSEDAWNSILNNDKVDGDDGGDPLDWILAQKFEPENDGEDKDAGDKTTGLLDDYKLEKRNDGGGDVVESGSRINGADSLQRYARIN